MKSATTINRRYQTAWAAVSKRSGKVLLNLHGHLAIYTRKEEAELDCPKYGEARKIRLSVPISKGAR